jgi:transcriptional regulator with XRE-family HTH domain
VSDPTENHTPALGPRLRQARRTAEISLRELARACGISAAQLSKIETGKTPLTLRQCDTIRKALGLPWSALLPPESPSHYVIAKREAISEHLARPMDGRTFTVVPLADSYAGKRIEPYYYRNKAYDEREHGLVAHETEHFIFVLEGTLEISQADGGTVAKDRLCPGDALYWHCDVPHATGAHGKEDVDFFTVRYQPHGVENTLYDELGTRRLPGFRVGVERDAVSESGRKIAFMRQSRGLTAPQLAGLTGIGVRQLAGIESGRRTVSLDQLFKIAHVFRRPVRYFLDTDGREGPVRTVVRADAVRDLAQHQRGSDVFVPMAPGMPTRSMHPYHVRLALNRPPALVQHGGQTCVYVLHGEVEFRTARAGQEVVEILRPGDSLFLECSVAYDLRGYSKSPYSHSPSEMIQVFWNAGGSELPFFTS